MKLIIFVGSDNPVKVNSVVIAVSETYPEAEVSGIAVPSGVSEQPVTDDETRLGAENRARRVLERGLQMLEVEPEEDAVFLGVGLEGGVTQHQGEMWSTVWGVVCTQEDELFHANGARMKVPQPIAQMIERGQEMGPVVAQLAGKDDVRKKQGMIGVVTNNFVDRTEEYAGIAKLALGLWHGRSWDENLKVEGN